jgi:hypothetical protein
LPAFDQFPELFLKQESKGIGDALLPDTFRDKNAPSSPKSRHKFRRQDYLVAGDPAAPDFCEDRKMENRLVRGGAAASDEAVQAAEASQIEGKCGFDHLEGLKARQLKERKHKLSQ